MDNHNSKDMDFNSNPINNNLLWKSKYQNTSQKFLDMLIENQSRVLAFLMIGIFAMVISMHTFSRDHFAENQAKQISIPADVLILKNLLHHKTVLNAMQMEEPGIICEAIFQEERSCQLLNQGLNTTYRK
jgi:hypothetical protein